MADKDYGLYVHGEPYLGPKGEGYQKTYERWIASKMSYYRSNGVFTELGTVNGYQVGVKGVTEEAMDLLLSPGAGPGANLDSQLVLSEASVKSLIASAEENAELEINQPTPGGITNDATNKKQRGKKKYLFVLLVLAGAGYYAYSNSLI